MLLRRLACFLLLSLVSAWAGAAEMALTDTQGRIHRLEDYRGKWVVLNLWATWCSPCLAEMPELEALSQARNDLVILGLEGDGQSPQRLAEFARKLKVTYPIIVGNMDLVQHFGGRVFPTTLLFDPTGKRVLTHEGPITRKRLEDVMQRQGQSGR